jgi:hypothetical protein
MMCLFNRFWSFSVPSVVKIVSAIVSIGLYLAVNYQ